MTNLEYRDFINSRLKINSEMLHLTREVCKSIGLSDDEFIMCNNLGMAVEDIMVARKIFDLALEKGVGRKIPL